MRSSTVLTMHYVGVLLAIRTVGDLRLLFSSEEYSFDGLIRLRRSKDANGVVFMASDGTMQLYKFAGKVDPTKLIDVVVDPRIDNNVELPYTLAPYFSSLQRALDYVRRSVRFVPSPDGTVLTEEEQEEFRRALLYTYISDTFQAELASYLVRVN